MVQYSIRPPQRMGTSAILALLASVGSMFLSCSGRPVWGLILAVLTIPFGLVGFIRAASPDQRRVCVDFLDHCWRCGHRRGAGGDVCQNCAVPLVIAVNSALLL